MSEAATPVLPCAESFVRDNTVPGFTLLVPELRLHLASEITPIWQATETWLAERNVEPPFWAFAWPGGQALARQILDHPGMVPGKRVLDFAAGGGIAAIACARAGAARVEAAEIDRLAIAAIRLNAAANGVMVAALAEDVVGTECRWDLILCGDVCYEAPMTGHILPWLRRMAEQCEVWVADPGRAYLPRQGLQGFATYRVTDHAGTGGSHGTRSHAVSAWRLSEASRSRFGPIRSGVGPAPIAPEPQTFEHAGRQGQAGDQPHPQLDPVLH